MSIIKVTIFFIKGRYSSSKYGFLLPAKIAWITQESPSFIVPVILLLTTSSAFWNSTVNKMLLTGFIIHYVNRLNVLNYFLFTQVLFDKPRLNVSISGVLSFPCVLVAMKIHHLYHTFQQWHFPFSMDSCRGITY